MDIQKIYRQLDTLDIEEKIACEYFQTSGRTLNYFQISRVLQHNPDVTAGFDFSCLETEEAKLEAQRLSEISQSEQTMMLPEHSYIAKHFNVELNNVQRYIQVPAHQHDFYEIVCTLKGECRHMVESQIIPMQLGDIVIIPPHIRHAVSCTPGSIAVNIKIRKSTFDRVFIQLLQNQTPLSDYFAQTLYSHNYQNSLTFHCGEDAFLMELILYLYTQQEEAKPYANEVIDGLISTFFSYLIQNFENTMEFSSAQTDVNQRMVQIENYIRQNYRTASLKSTAQQFYLSQPYLSTIIRRQTGRSFSQILRDIRMRAAGDMLLHTHMKVDDICEAVGYHDTTQFIRTFRQIYGTTPKQYQKNNIT